MSTVLLFEGDQRGCAKVDKGGEKSCFKGNYSRTARADTKWESRSTSHNIMGGVRKARGAEGENTSGIRLRLNQTR